MEQQLYFQTCEDKGLHQDIVQASPFKSEQNKRQWLTQGYYFWIEDIELAHLWGRFAKRNSYVIVQYNLDFSDFGPILDLISSPKQIRFFSELLNRLLTRLRTEKECVELTVSDVINYYKKLHSEGKMEFPFKGIKCCDEQTKRQLRFRYTDKKGCLEETIALNNRHQICLFEIDEKVIKDKSLTFPVANVA